MSGGESHAEIEFSSMKQPPLIKQLKGILSEYPDGGQILKVVYFPQTFIIMFTLGKSCLFHFFLYIYNVFHTLRITALSV
jgi:hypothetical protein